MVLFHTIREKEDTSEIGHGPRSASLARSPRLGKDQTPSQRWGRYGISQGRKMANFDVFGVPKKYPIHTRGQGIFPQKQEALIVQKLSMKTPKKATVVS